MNADALDNSRRWFLKSTTASIFAGEFSRSRTSLGQLLQAVNTSVDSLVASVRHFGNQFLDNPLGVTGVDGATSTLLPTGESLWLFGDTVEEPFETIRGLDLTNLCSNTAALVPPQDASRGIRKFRFSRRQMENTLASSCHSRPTKTDR